MARMFRLGMLWFVLNWRVSCSLDYAAGLDCARLADLACAEAAFEASLASGVKISQSSHALATLALIAGDARRGAELRRAAKVADVDAIPPLAELTMTDKCSGLGEVYWICAFSLKALDEADDWASVAYEAHTTLGTVLADAGATPQAEVHFRAALSFREGGELRFRLALTVPAVLSSREEARTAPLELRHRVKMLLNETSRLERLDQLSMPGTFYIVYLGGRDAALMCDINEAYRRAYPAIVQPPAQRLLIKKQSTLRVGFVSSYFRRHSVCKLLCGVIRELGLRHGIETRLYVAQDAEMDDDMTNYALEGGAQMVRLDRGGTTISNRQDHVGECDVLVFADMGMDSRTAMWASARLAKVQVLFWGHPHTSGLPDTVDYFVSADSYEDDEERYAEQLVRFDSLSFFFRHPREAGYLAPRPNGLRERLLPDCSLETAVYLVPQSLQKFHPDFDAVLIGLALALAEEDAVILVTYDPSKSLWLHVLRKRLALPDMGVIRFVPMVKGSDYMHLLQTATLLLDPFPFGGGVTTLEAFSVCKVVVSAPKLQTVVRLAAGMYAHMGLGSTEALVPDAASYVAAALRLGRDRERRELLESAICASAETPETSLFSSAAAVDEWADFLRAAASAAALPS